MQTLIKPQIEKVLKQIILKDLSKGRADFDKPHTQAVVYWMKYALSHIAEIQALNLDSQVMITAAYAHDWGYVGLFKHSNSNTLKDIMKAKQLHMSIGAIKIERLLHQRLSRYFTQNQILKIAHLVQFHDAVEKLQTQEELLLMEIDTLGALDADRVKPSFSKEENEKFITNSIYKRRLPAFVHQDLKDIAEKLIIKRMAQYK